MAAVGDERAVSALMQVGIPEDRAREIVRAGDVAQEIISLGSGSMLVLLERVEQLDADVARSLVFAFATTLATVREQHGSFNGPGGPREVGS